MSAYEFVGYAIVSADGMLAAQSPVMPDSLKFPGDQRFFEAGLDRVDLIVHGRNSYEDQPRSPQRRRLIVTRGVSGVAAAPDNSNATLWNPAGASFEAAARRAGVTGGVVAIIGGTDVFDMFLDRYDAFFLSQAPGVNLPGGVPVLSGIPARTPQQILRAHGLRPATADILDADHGVAMTPWRRG